MNCLLSIIIYLKTIKRSSKYDTTQFLSSIQVPCLTEGQSAKCEFLISEEELICTLKNVPKNKSPGNDGLTKEFYETFWEYHSLVVLDKANSLKLVSAIFYQIFIFLSNDRSSKTMKNVFYFI